MTEKINGAKYVAALPASTEPWQFTTFRGRVIAANPEHGTFIIEEGRITPVTSEGAGEVYVGAAE